MPKRKAKPKLKARSKAKPKAQAKPKARAKPKASPEAKPVRGLRLDPLCGQCGARHPFGTDCDPAQLISFARVQRNMALIDHAVESQQPTSPTRSKRPRR
jgi:outer membrane biosynthesis protein TonB